MDDLIERLRQSTARHYGDQLKNDRPDFGLRGSCPGGNERTVPVRTELPPNETWVKSQCAGCDWWAGTPVGSLIGRHDRVWRDSDGRLM